MKQLAVESLLEGIELDPGFLENYYELGGELQGLGIGDLGDYVH